MTHKTLPGKQGGTRMTRWDALAAMYDTTRAPQRLAVASTESKAADVALDFVFKTGGDLKLGIFELHRSELPKKDLVKAFRQAIGLAEEPKRKTLLSLIAQGLERGTMNDAAEYAFHHF